ncbi:MAG: arylsulfatase A-like enzyme [Candidatus Binatia bacterium]|jgi:arylsulfatase B
MRHSPLRFLICGLIFGSFAAPATATDKPNILFILADDMGYGDLGFTGSQLLKTPHLDALAKSGVFCSQGYVASPVCSPSRAGLITGRDPRRFGYEGNMNQAASNYATRPELLGLPPGEHTLGDHLRAAGYATGLIGKWHLGIGAGFHPNERGFDYFCGMQGGGHGYFPDPRKNKLDRNGEPLTEFSTPYLTDFFTDEALSWIKRQNDETKPWFLFLSYNAPHGPMHATEEDLARFSHIEDKKRRTYAAMMFALDRGVGRVRDLLKESDQTKNTLIVFFSDNGGATSNASWNGPLSGVKGCLREGGVRVPMFWSWPGVLPAGKSYDSPASSLDLLPTFLAAAGAEPLPLRKPLSHEDKRMFNQGVERFGAYDGINLLPHLKGEQKPAERTLFWRLQGQTAIRHGDDKLIRLSHRPAQLFQPGTDLAEARDLADDDADKFRDLFRQLGEWEAGLPTVPLWGSSPYWIGQSAKHYDEWLPRPEPR